MATLPISTADLPLPEEDPVAWATIYIAGLPCPGQYLCDQSEGDRERDTQHKKSKGGSADILVDQGLMPKVGKIKIRTIKPEIYRALYDFYLKYMDPERALSRLNIVTISHPQMYSRGIKMAYFKKAPIPKPTRGGGTWPFISEFDFNVINPKTQIGAAGKSSKPKAQFGINPYTEYTFKSAQERAAITSISAVAAEQRAQLKTNQSRPPNQTPILYTPADVSKFANAGDPSARFLSDSQARFAPR